MNRNICVLPFFAKEHDQKPIVEAEELTSNDKTYGLHLSTSQSTAAGCWSVCCCIADGAAWAGQHIAAS